MDALVIANVRAERDRLAAKLAAADAFLQAFGEETAPTEGPANVHMLVLPAVPGMPAGTKLRDFSSRNRDKMTLDRYTAYGSSVVRAAIEAVRHSPVVPVPTRRLVELIEATGVELRGEDKANALSALLARSADLNTNGRRGWTLASFDKRYGRTPDENEASTANATDASETALDAQDGRPQE